MQKVKCNHCQEWKDPDDFNWRFKTLGIRHPTCRECAHGHNKKYYEGDAKERHLKQVKERTNAAREAARDFVYQHLLTHPCESCGESDPRVLEFHHVGEKELAVSELTKGGYSIERIRRELNRCQVLCSNCHRKLTVEERGWYRGRK